MARPKLPGSVYQRADGKWVAQLRIDGRKVRRYASSERAAIELLKDMRAKPPKITPAAIRTMTVADYVAHWLEDSLAHQGLAESTQAMYTSVGRSVVIPALGSMRMATFDPSSVEAWLRKVDTLRTKPRTPRPTRKNPDPEPIPGHPLSASTKRIAYGVLEKALNTAVRDGLIESNPVKTVPRPKPGKPTVPVVAPDQADLALQGAQGKRIETLLWFVTWTGVRIGEALALRWEDVDFERATATIKAGAVGSDRTKTAAGTRSVTLIPEVVDRLKAWQKAQKADRLKMGSGWANTGNLVFVTGAGLPMDPHNCRRDLQRILKDQGLPTERPWHSLRHGFATRLLQRGMPLQVVSAMLGHSSIRVTSDVYGHVNPAVDQDVLVAALGRG
jgi:integrase